MFNVESGIDSLTNFKRQTAEFLDRLHAKRRTAGAHRQRQGAGSDPGCRRVPEIGGSGCQGGTRRNAAAIREGLADVKAGRTKPARAVLDRLAKKYGITCGKLK